ncbi:MAG TPA: ABC transporter ATP-binding protein [Acidimicrobiia bacterium]|nr:ABC transporter ATP-binding protein [Acidimicrobiia bacterium]
MTLLELSGIRAGYGIGPDIMTGVDLEVEAGRTYCIIGPNGAGKSTLLKTICGILKPRAGAVSFEGKEIGGLRPDQVLARGICFVPQDRTLFPDMTVRENLVMGGYLIRDRKALNSQMDRVMELFPILAERSAQLAQTMSGGEQQMLAMARALMIQPKLMMIDEPSLGLAPQPTVQVFEIMGRLRDEMDVTILLVEQNVRKGLEVSDWAFVLDLGTKRFEGPADQILADARIRDLYLGKGPSSKGEDHPPADTGPADEGIGSS